MSRQSAVLSRDVPDVELPDLTKAWLAMPANDSEKPEVDFPGDAHRPSLAPARPIGRRLRIGGIVATALIGVVAAAGAMALTIGRFSATDHTASTGLSLSMAGKPLDPSDPQVAPSRLVVSTSELAEGLNVLRSQMRAGQMAIPHPEPQGQTAPTQKAEREVVSADPATPVTVVAAASATPAKDVAAPQPGPATDEIRAMLGRAKGLLAVGDIAAARRLTEYAAVGGNGEAVFLLAETFDPKQLARWRVRGVRADVERARSLYQQALRQGVAEAQPRLAELP